MLSLLPGRPIVADICVTQPLGAPAVNATAQETGAKAKAEDSLEWDKYSRTGTGACRSIALGQKPIGRAGPAALLF